MKSVPIVLLVLAYTGQTVGLFSDRENAQLPRLFHLDDHDRCLLQEGGLYCLGEFDLSPVGYSEMYENIKKYKARDIRAFNRSRLYRGYCVSERCPQKTLTLKNESQRFEECVNKRARRHALTARLRTLKYCVTEQQHRERATQSPDSAQQLFLRVVYALLALNIVGTVYDFTHSDKNKNMIIVSWSIRASWRRLTAIYEDGDPRLKQLESIQGLRVFVMLIMICAHCGSQPFQFYVTTPQNLELLLTSFYGVIVANGTSVIQMFVMLSSFLTAYNVLIHSEKHKLSLFMVPVLVVKRIIRTAPVHLLIVGFAATYWPAMRPGATSALIEENSVICRRKFWSHVLFLNNIVEKQDHCLPPSWFIPVDLHMFIVASTLTIIMSRRSNYAVYLYASLFVLSSALCGLVAYINEWQTIASVALPDNVLGILRNQATFTEFYMSSWGSLPACFLGLCMAHLHYELQKKKYDWNQNQWLKRLSPWSIPAIMLSTYVMDMFRKKYSQHWVMSSCVAIDRPLIIFTIFVSLITGLNIEDVQRRFFAWRGWRVPGRLSLPMMLCHWIISVAIAARPVAYYTSVFDISIELLATVFYGYLISVPVALLVEIPIQRLFAQLF